MSDQPKTFDPFLLNAIGMKFGLGFRTRSDASGALVYAEPLIMRMAPPYEDTGVSPRHDPVPQRRLPPPSGSGPTPPRPPDGDPPRPRPLPPPEFA